MNGALRKVAEADGLVGNRLDDRLLALPPREVASLGLSWFSRMRE